MLRSLRALRPSLAEWLCLIGGSWLVLRYSWLMDDAFVYFRYVDNLVYLDLGLVFNSGEYVEGFSSPLWTLILAVGRALQANYWFLVRALGLASFAAFWLLVLLSHRRLSSGQALNVPLILLSFNYAVLTSFTSGLETPLVQVAAAAFAWHVLEPRSRAGQVLVGLAPLVRHELALPWLLSVAWARWRSGSLPRWSLATALGTLGAWILFRIYYYADFLPNTYYLKNSTWVGQGLAYLWDTVYTYGLFVLIPAALAGGWWLHRGDRSLPKLKPRFAMAALALSVAIYVVKIGGDFLHYRYLAFSFPLLLIALSGVGEATLERLPRRVRRWAIPVAGVALAVATFSQYPARLDRHPYTLQARLVETESLIEDAMAHRSRPELARRSFESGATHDKQEAYEEFRASGQPYRFRQLIADYWCVRIYDQFGWYTVQSLGLTDPVLARIDVPSNRPGHRWTLHPLGQQLVTLRAKYGFGPGLYQKAIRGGDAPDWFAPNLEVLRTVDRRAFNRHDFLENLGLALRRPGRIHLVSPPPEVPTRRGRKLGNP